MDRTRTGVPRRSSGTVKLTVNLTPGSVAALDQAMEFTGDSGTDAVNRAVQLYAYLVHRRFYGLEIWIRDPEDGTDTELVADWFPEAGPEKTP